MTVIGTANTFINAPISIDLIREVMQVIKDSDGKYRWSLSDINFILRFDELTKEERIFFLKEKVKREKERIKL